VASAGTAKTETKGPAGCAEERQKIVKEKRRTGNAAQQRSTLPAQMSCKKPSGKAKHKEKKGNL